MEPPPRPPSNHFHTQYFVRANWRPYTMKSHGELLKQFVPTGRGELLKQLVPVGWGELLKPFVQNKDPRRLMTSMGSVDSPNQSLIGTDL